MSAVPVMVPPKDRLQANLDRELGPVIRAWLEEPSTEDVALNPDGTLWVKCEGRPWEMAGEMATAQASSLLSVIAAMCGTVVNSDVPILETELPGYNARFEGIRFPVVSQPSFSIRKIAGRLHTLREYVQRGILSERYAELLRGALTDRKNIVLAGGPGSGKTTLLNALIATLTEECPHDRIAMIEDTLELRCCAPNHVPLHATAKVGMLRCLKACLRLRVDRLVVGEVRGAEALTLLKSWNTGHPGGLATVHATSAHGALTRLESLAAEATKTARLRELIGEAVHLIVFVAPERDTQRYPAGRRVQEIVAVHGFSKGKYHSEGLMG
jgi:P-type conjugative transfer ATPase TrbB